jgi:hypothetical protein
MRFAGGGANSAQDTQGSRRVAGRDRQVACSWGVDAILRVTRWRCPKLIACKVGSHCNGRCRPSKAWCDPSP